MANKDKTFPEKLKQFFRFNKQGGNFQPGVPKLRAEFILTPEIEAEIGPKSPMVQRLKVIKELGDIVVTKRLEENAVETLWICLEDLLQPSAPKEYRHAALTLFRQLVTGQTERLGLFRAKIFGLINQWENPEDLGLLLELLKALTDKGKDLLYFEEHIGSFLGRWLPKIAAAESFVDFLPVLEKIVKFNAAYLDPSVVSEIVQHLCAISCHNLPKEQVILCLSVLDAIVCYSNLPTDALPCFTAGLCRLVNERAYCADAWKVMRNLLGTYLGSTALYTMLKFLQTPEIRQEVALTRGAVFCLSMSLWTSKSVAGLNHSPTVVLPSFREALACNHPMVTYEVLLGIQRLLRVKMNDLQSVVWDLILEMLEKSLPFTTYTQIGTVFHEILTSIEQSICHCFFGGNFEHFYSLVDQCVAQRPEISVLHLLSFVSDSLTPAKSDWIQTLASLMDKFLVRDYRSAIKLKALDLLTSMLVQHRALYEDELLEHVLTPCLQHIDGEPDHQVRTAAVNLMIEAVMHCTTNHALDIMGLLRKTLDRPFDHPPDAVSIVEDSELLDVQAAVQGLTQVFKHKVYELPSSHALKAYKLLVRHLDNHYKKPLSCDLASMIRFTIFECMLQIRADPDYRLGFVSQSRYSPYLIVDHKHGERNPVSRRSSVGNKASTATVESVTVNQASSSLAPCRVTHVSLTEACMSAITCLNKERDWKVLHLVLKEIPHVLSNKALILSRNGSDVDYVANALCSLVSDRSLSNPDSLRNAPPKFSRTDFQAFVFPVLTSLAAYHAYLKADVQQRLVKCLEAGLKSATKSCIVALTISALEMRETMYKMLPEVLLNLSKLSATVQSAAPILEFLSTMIRLPQVYGSFVEDQYMSIFAIALAFTNPFKFNHYTVSLAHRVIAFWFLKCKTPFRRGFVKFIVSGLRSNVILPCEEGLQKPDMVNEDSSNRKRSSSLTDPHSDAMFCKGSRRKDTSRMDETMLHTFHTELTEVTLDFLARYTYASCHPQTRRSPSSARLLAQGCSQTWLLGYQLITVTTSGCSQIASEGKDGLCDRCYLTCRLLIKKLTDEPVANGQDGQLESGGRRRHRSAVMGSETAETPPQQRRSRHRTSAEGRNFAEPREALFSIAGTREQSKTANAGVCVCWCQGWAEIHVRRPTGDTSWIMRVQNQPLFTNNGPTSADPSSAFLPPLDDVNWTETVNPETKLSVPENSNGQSPPGSPLSLKFDAEEGVVRSPGQTSVVSVDFEEKGVTFPTRDKENRAEDEEEESETRKGRVVRQSSVKDVSRKGYEIIPEEQLSSSLGKDVETHLRKESRVEDAKSEGETKSQTEMELKRKEKVEENLTSSVKLPTAHSFSVKSSDEDIGLPPMGFRSRVNTMPTNMSNIRRIMSDSSAVDSLAARRGTIGPVLTMGKDGISNTSNMRAGISPSFVFVQLYYSSEFGKIGLSPLLVPKTDVMDRAIGNLDLILPYETHKVGVVYVGKGQAGNETAILSNQHGSLRYVQFIKGLGSLVNLEELDPQTYNGGLDRKGNDGKFAYMWEDDVLKVVFHVATLMPTLANNPLCNNKKLHIGNDFVTIVYNDSGEEYSMKTIKGQFTYACVIVEPLEHSTNLVSVHYRPELNEMLGHSEPKLVSDSNVAILARQLALHAHLAAHICQARIDDPFSSNWLKRLHQIKRIKSKIVNEANQSDQQFSQPVIQGSKRNSLLDFTEFA